MSRADDARPTTPVSLFSSYKPVPIRRIAANPPTKPAAAEPKPTAEQSATSASATKHTAPPTTATTCGNAPSKASTLARLANAQASSTALVPTVRPRSSSLRPHPRQTTVAFGRTTLVNGKTSAPKTPRAPKTPVFTAAAATTTASARPAMSQDLSALKKKAEENAKEISELKTLVRELQARDEAQQSEIDDLRRSLIRLLERSALGSTRRATNTSAAARLNATVPAPESDSQRENRPPSRELQPQRDVTVQRRKRDDAAAQQREEDLLNRIERLDPSEQRVLRKRLEGDAPQQRQKTAGERFRERSPSEDDSRGAMSITRRITHIEETRAMASPRRAAPPPISDYSNNTRQFIERSRRESPRGRRQERSHVVEPDSDREDYRRDVPRRNQQRRPVIRELSPGDEDYSPPRRFDDDHQTDYEPYFVSHRNDDGY